MSTAKIFNGIQIQPLLYVILHFQNYDILTVLTS